MLQMVEGCKYRLLNKVTGQAIAVVEVKKHEDPVDTNGFSMSRDIKEETLFVVYESKIPTFKKNDLVGLTNLEDFMNLYKIEKVNEMDYVYLTTDQLHDLIDLSVALNQKEWFLELTTRLKEYQHTEN